MKMLWWEKTVEYFFISEYAKIDRIIAALDGNQEKAGDAIFSDSNKWILIEFKKDIGTNCIAQEKDKYHNYKAAKDALVTQSNHHLMIYGKIKNNLFQISCIKYFTLDETHKYEIDINKAIKSGTNIYDFIIYINKFIKFKKSKKDERVGTDGDNNEDKFLHVAGVTKDGKISTCIELSRFIEFSNSPSTRQRMIDRPSTDLGEEQELGMGMGMGN